MNAQTLNMAVDLAGIRLRNPVMTASGTFGYGEEFADYVDLHKIGAYITKGLSPRPRPGNPTPRTAETPAGMLNAIGLQNVGIDAFIEKKSCRSSTALIRPASPTFLETILANTRKWRRASTHCPKS